MSRITSDKTIEVHAGKKKKRKEKKESAESRERHFEGQAGKVYLPFPRHRAAYRTLQVHAALTSSSSSSSVGASSKPPWKPREKRESRGSTDLIAVGTTREYNAERFPYRGKMSLSFSLSVYLYVALFPPRACSEPLGCRRHVKNAARDAHTREARNRLARLARRDLRPLRQRHLLRTDAAPAAARPRKNPPRCIAPSSCAARKEVTLRGYQLSKYLIEVSKYLNKLQITSSLTTVNK